MHMESAHHNRSTGDLTSHSAILSTKLYRPFVSVDLEPRAELVARLERNRHQALTVISAPTGYGKSTLASMWLSASEAAGGWISLDAEDDDPELFLAYVVAAIQSVFPNLQLHVQALLGTGILPAPAAIARGLLNDLERIPRQLLLVLDDLHVIRSQAIYDFLAELLRHPSPKLHLVLISRRDPPLPLPSLRAHRQITEIRARDLRFSIAETARLLAKILNQEVDHETASRWTERTEGWVTALGLAALALRQRGQHDISPHDESIDSHHLQEYLLADVMNGLEPRLREWLLTIAWLDRFCPALCAAVCQPEPIEAQTDFTGEAFVQRLRDDNLFLISLDSEQQWFRLHHLFREVLRGWGRSQFSEAEIAVLYRRTGEWFARHELPDEAIRYLILGGDYDAAERVVQKHRYMLMNLEQWSRLERWLRQFPDTVRETRALLVSISSILSIHFGKYRQVALLARRAEALLTKLPPGSSIHNDVLGEVSAVMATLALAEGDPEALVSGAQRALQLLPDNAHLLRDQVEGVIAAGMQIDGHYEEGCRFLEDSLDRTPVTQFRRLRLMNYLCLISFLQGDLSTTQAWAERVLHVAEERHLAELLYIARHFLGVVHYLRNELGAAEALLTPLTEEYFGTVRTYISMATFALALIYDDRGEFARANAVIDRLVSYYQDAGDTIAMALVDAFSVELALRRDDAGAAQRRRVGVDFAPRPPLWFFYIPQLTPIKLLLIEGTAEALGAARAALDEYEARMSVLHRNLARIDGLALLALVCDQQGDSDGALANLIAALRLACDAGLIRPFVDQGANMAVLLRRLRDSNREGVQEVGAFITDILDAFPTAAPYVMEKASPLRHEHQERVETVLLPEPLTEREVQVLQQLATQLTPAEIAARYVVSVSTVRSQIKSIYRKLDVHSRKDAVRRSRELKLI